MHGGSCPPAWCRSFSSTRPPSASCCAGHPRPRVRRLAGTALALGLACAPYLAWREVQSYGPRNVIHTAPQGLLWLFDGARVVSVGVLWNWLGSWWVLFPAAAVWLWRGGAER